MAKLIKVSYGYVEYEPGDKVIARWDAIDVSLGREEIHGGEVATVRRFWVDISDEVHCVLLDGYSYPFGAIDFVLAPGQEMKEEN